MTIRFIEYGWCCHVLGPDFPSNPNQIGFGVTRAEAVADMNRRLRDIVNAITHIQWSGSGD